MLYRCEAQAPIGMGQKYQSQTARHKIDALQMLYMLDFGAYRPCFSKNIY